MALILISVCTLVLTYARNGFSNPCQWESNYFCLRVVDASDPQYGTAKALILDHLLHGINHEAEPDLLISSYVHAMDEIVRVFFQAQQDSHLRYFFAGGGAYTQPRAVKAMYPSARITVAELDPQVTATAEEALYVNNDGMEIIHLDARAVLQTNQQQYDVIVTDVFHDISVPYHLVTQEFAQSVKQNLSEEGLYLVNIVDAFPDAKLVKSLIKTLQQEFSHVDVWLDVCIHEQRRGDGNVIAGCHHCSETDQNPGFETFDPTFFFLAAGWQDDFNRHSCQYPGNQYR